MKTNSKPRNPALLAVLAATVAASGALSTAIPAHADDKAATGEAKETKENQQKTTDAGVSASMYFTDAQGNRRQPTEEEITRAAKAFQRDLARLAGKHKDKPYTQKRPDGTVSATIAASKLVFLSVQQNDDGTLTYGHTSMKDDGSVSFEPATGLPEK